MLRAAHHSHHQLTRRTAFASLAASVLALSRQVSAAETAPTVYFGNGAVLRPVLAGALCTAAMLTPCCMQGASGGDKRWLHCHCQPKLRLDLT